MLTLFRRAWPVPVVKALVPVVILLTAAGAVAYLIDTRPEPAIAEGDQRIWPVSALRLEVADRQPTLDLYGEVVAGRMVDVTAAVGGELTAVGDGFREGGLVAAGDLLVQIDPFDYEIALAERAAELAEARARLAELEARLSLEIEALEQDQAMLALEESQVARRERLVGSGAGTQQALDDARMALLAQRRGIAIRTNTIAAERARIDQQVAIVERLTARRDLARRNLERTRLVAPFTGILDAVTAEQGQRIRADDPIAHLIDPDRLEVRFHLTERDYGRLVGTSAPLVGRVAEATWQLGRTRLVFSATVERVDGTIDSATGGVDVFAALAGVGPDTALRPGAFVEVSLPGQHYADVAELPAEALFDGDDGPVVYVIGDDDRLQRRRVTLAASFEDRVLVAGDVADGERVVTSRFAGIADGVAVAVAD